MGFGALGSNSTAFGGTAVGYQALSSNTAGGGTNRPCPNVSLPTTRREGIHDMGEGSASIHALRPMAFHYKPEYDPQDLAEFGLVAEEVEKIDSALVVHDLDGKPFTVRYGQVNAMLLNEFLKEHVRVQAQSATIAELGKMTAQQQREIADLKVEMQKQAELVWRISTRLESDGQTSRTIAEGR